VLTRGLVADGHAVRAVTRTEEHRPAIEQAGAECWRGDPDVIGTLRYALENVTILVWALGTASGAGDIAALHGSRLQTMLERTIDTTVRGVVYEAAGTVAADVLRAGEAEVRRARETNEIPYRVVRRDPAEHDAWARAARGAIEELLVR
jgi:hypothetical protein